MSFLRLALPSLAGLLLSVAPLAGITPENQCPLDCSPCLGPEDPFCPYPNPYPPGYDPTAPDYECLACHTVTNRRGTVTRCERAYSGEVGADLGCTIRTEGIDVTFCEPFGVACTGITVTP